MKFILLVDDSLDTVNLVKEVLKDDKDLHVDYAPDARTAIKMFNSNEYNACILDVSLPDITGYYLGHIIRQACPEMPLAFLTNYTSDTTAENAKFINAKFWKKTEVFSNLEELPLLFKALTREHRCGGNAELEFPSILNEVAV